MPRGGARQGARRKATGKKSSTRSLTLTDKEWAMLEKHAEKIGTTPTRLAAELIRDKLNGE